MGFKERIFGDTYYKEQEIEPKKLFIISCEGSNTEPEYFEALKNKLASKIHFLIEIEIVPKMSEAADPQSVVDNLETFLASKYDFNENSDECWVVWDREKDEGRKKNILKIMPLCKKKNYQIAMTNPSFEFWLLLHITDIKKFDKTHLFENNWVNTKRRFLEKKLSVLLPGGFNKKRGKFNKRIVSEENVKFALSQEKLFERELPKIINNLGSNIGDLVSKILGISNRKKISSPKKIKKA